MGGAMQDGGSDRDARAGGESGAASAPLEAGAASAPRESGASPALLVVDEPSAASGPREDDESGAASGPLKRGVESDPAPAPLVAWDDQITVTLDVAEAAARRRE